MTPPLTISIACLISALVRALRLKARLPRDSRFLRGLRGFVGLPAEALLLGAGSVSSLVVIENPILCSDEVDGSEGADDDQQEPGHGRGVSHIKLAEALLVKVEREE